MTSAKQERTNEKAFAAAAVLLSVGGLYIAYALPFMWPLAWFCGVVGVVAAVEADRAGAGRKLALKQIAQARRRRAIDEVPPA